MNERERAEIVARAIDALIRGADTNETASTGDEELDSLLEVARARLETSLFAAKAGVQHEAAVWAEVLKRVEAGTTTDTFGADSDDEAADEFAEIIAMRRKLTEDALLLAESHRLAVWDKVRFRPLRRRTDARTWAVDRDIGSASSHLRSSMPGAQAHLATAQMAESTQELARARVWARVTSSVGSEGTTRSAAERRGYRRFAPRFALAAAAVTLLAFSIGPLPATGFADHPAAWLVESVDDHFGAREAPPPSLAALPTPDFVNGREASAAQASTLAGAQFIDPSSEPTGFQLTSSRFYPQGMSGDGGGIFVLTYASNNSFLTVYQEAAGGSDLAVEAGAMTALTLADGTDATLIDGAWTAGAGSLTWSSGADETLVFERAGVRVIAELHGGATDGFLAEFANSLH